MKPEIKVAMEWEAYDKLFVDMILEGYETTYWAFLETEKDLQSDPVKYSYKQEDYWHELRILNAFELLAGHYTSRDEHVRMLADIRDRMTIKAKIAKGMSQCM